MIRVSATELRPDYWISTIIKGYSNPGGALRGFDSASALADMTAFVDAGITTIDCCDGDQGFERLVGSFRQDLRRTHGLTVAETVRVHTRFVPDLAVPHAFNQDQVENSIDRSIARLGVDALDMVQLDWPDTDTSGCLDGLGYLTLMQAKGKIHHIGIANFDADHLKMFIQSGIDLVAAKVPFSLIDQRPRGEFADLCRRQNIALLAYGTLAGGFISHRWLGAPDPGYSFETPSLARHRLVIEAFGGWGLFQELLLALSAIAARHGVTLSSVALRAVHGHADVAAVILRTSHGDQLDSHLKAFNFTPTERDRETLANVSCQEARPQWTYLWHGTGKNRQYGKIFKCRAGQYQSTLTAKKAQLKAGSGHQKGLPYRSKRRQEKISTSDHLTPMPITDRQERQG